MSIMIIVEENGIKDVLITGKSDGEEKDSMKMLLGFQGIVNTETMVAVSREEAIKLL